MNKLRIAYLQQDIIWENPSANLNKIDKYIDKLENIDLLILPEMFNSGFTMNTEQVSENMQGRTFGWMKERALENNIAIMGSAIIKSDDAYFNRLGMAFPCSSIKFYDKRHLFRMGGEHEKFTAGTKKVILPFFGWRIRALTCYDLRFPVWSRNCNDYDLLIYVANWPEARAEVWNTLLKARAIENQCYVVGVNRVGTDGTGLTYSGNSVVIDPKGQVISSVTDAKEELGIAEISLSELNIFRDKFPVGNDADSFTVHTKQEP